MLGCETRWLLAPRFFHRLNPVVIHRFHIEDLIAQDASGVTFRAVDTETGNTVAVRRFFPFGANGGGLVADEQTAYQIAVSRLAELHHPSLRATLCGGCDPIDGMPFIATEWIEGPSIQSFIDQGPLRVEVATELISQALEVCERLSDVLGEEAVWVETQLTTILADPSQNHRSFTFWILLGPSPLKAALVTTRRWTWAMGTVRSTTVPVPRTGAGMPALSKSPGVP